MIKRILLTTGTLLFLAFGLIAQTSPELLSTYGQKSGPVTLELETVSAIPGFPLTIQVEAKDFAGHEVGAMTLKIGFDPAQLTFTGISSVQNPQGWLMNASGSTLTILNSSLGGTINDGVLFELSCIYYGTDLVDITFKTGTEIVGLDLTPLTTIYVNGKIIPDTTPPATLIIGQVIAPIGNSVTIPVHASGFQQNIGAMTLKIGFPAGVLSFSGIVAHQGFNGFVGSSGDQITFLWASSSGKPLNNDLLLELKFNYLLDEKAPVVFNPGVEIVDIDQKIIPVHYVSGFVNTMPDGYKVSGILKYANEAGTPLTNSTVELWNEDGTIFIESTTTSEDGSYEFIGVIAGNYVLKASTDKTAGGVDVFDAFDVYDFWFTGSPNLTGIYFTAADVNEDGEVDAFDAFDIYDYWLNGVKPASWTAPPWVFENPLISVSVGDITIDIKGLCSGDVNADYDPIP